jgi:hypothetical protein
VKRKKNSKGINIGILNVQSSFDVVQHKILLDKLIDQSIHPTLWLIIKDLYSGLTSKVKWAGELSESFDILQGVRQGESCPPIYIKLCTRPVARTGKSVSGISAWRYLYWYTDLCR